MTRPLLLDLFCGAGGAAVGYHRAGFEVVGVDLNPQPRYPFTFIREDALEYAARYGRTFDAIHASPPCQAYSVATAEARSRGKTYPDLLGDTRLALRSADVPWVIENVPGSPTAPSAILCGTMFGLVVGDYELWRHRLFECSFPMPESPPCRHDRQAVQVVGKGANFRPRKAVTIAGNGGWYNPPRPREGRPRTIQISNAIAQRIMGIDWMNRNELSESIPPAYTEYVGRFLLAEVMRRRGLEICPCGQNWE